MATDQTALINELVRRRDSLPPDKQALVDELSKRSGSSTSSSPAPEAPKSKTFGEQATDFGKTWATDLINTPGVLLKTAGKAITSPLPEAWKPEWAKGESPVQDLGGAIIHVGQDIANKKYGEALGHGAAAYVGGKIIGAVPDIVAAAPRLTRAAKIGTRVATDKLVPGLKEARASWKESGIAKEPPPSSDLTNRLNSLKPAPPPEPLPPGSNPLPPSLARELPNSLPKRMAPPSPGAPQASEPTPLQRGMSPGARIPAPQPAVPIAPEPTVLQRQMGASARIPAPSPGAPGEVQPSVLQQGMDPSKQLPLPRPKVVKAPPPEVEGNQIPPTLAGQLPKSAPRKIPLPGQKPVVESTPEAAEVELRNSVTSPETSGPAPAIAVDKPALMRSVHSAASKKGYNHADVSSHAQERFGVNSLAELKEQQLLDMYAEYLREAGPSAGPALNLKSTGKPSELSLEDQLKNSIAATGKRAEQAKQLSGPVENPTKQPWYMTQQDKPSGPTKNSAQRIGKAIADAQKKKVTE